MSNWQTQIRKSHSRRRESRSARSLRRAVAEVDFIHLLFSNIENKPEPDAAWIAAPVESLLEILIRSLWGICITDVSAKMRHGEQNFHKLDHFVMIQSLFAC